MRALVPPLTRVHACIQARLNDNLSEVTRMTLDLSLGKPVSTFSVYQETIGPFLWELLPELRVVIKSSSETSYHDLFFWAILIGHEDLMFQLWKRSEGPVGPISLCSDRSIPRQACTTPHPFVLRQTTTDSADVVTADIDTRHSL